MQGFNKVLFDIVFLGIFFWLFEAKRRRALPVPITFFLKACGFLARFPQSFPTDFFPGARYALHELMVLIFQVTKMSLITSKLTTDN
jgi:hypothetical protein